VWSSLETLANAYAEGSVLRSQAGAGSTVDDPGGGIDDPGGGDTDDLGSFDNLATSTTTSSKTSVSFVSSSLTTGISLMSLSDKSAVDAPRLGGRRWYMDDCATGSFCSSCAIPPRVAGGLWSDGVGCDACCYPFGVLCRVCLTATIPPPFPDLNRETSSREKCTNIHK